MLEETPSGHGPAARGAHETIEEHEVLELTARDMERVLDVLMDPPGANERLQRAFKDEGLRVAW